MALFCRQIQTPVAQTVQSLYWLTRKRGGLSKRVPSPEREGMSECDVSNKSIKCIDVGNYKLINTYRYICIDL
jgi:hypothetical protein